MSLKVLQNNVEKNIETIRTQNGDYVNEIYAKNGNSYERVFVGTREISGEPELKYKSLLKNDNVLKDWRIYGNDGGVGDLVTDTADEHYGKYKIPVTVKGKNLLPVVNRMRNKNGITYTPLGNGAIMIDGTSTDFSRWVINSDVDGISGATDLELPVGAYTINYPYQSNTSLNDVSIQVQIRLNDGTFQWKSGTIILNEGDTVSAQVLIPPGLTINNRIIYPQLERGSTSTANEPYHDPIIANIYIDEPLAEGESVSMSDTGVAIPTISDTNILTVDTQVQPSRVDIKGKIKKTL